ncbi:MAG TPA: hypothetical protein VGH38_18760 [Bryobacteraceae bacterium]
MTISGSFLILFLYDVSEEIRLRELRGILNVPPAGREPPFRQPAPQYVQFAQPPVVEPVLGIALPGGPAVSGRVAYYDYGVVSLQLELPFEGGWQDIIDLSARWMSAPELEQRAAEAVRGHLERAAPALVHPYSEHLSEDYYMIQLRRITDGPDGPVTAPRLMEHCADVIAQIVRGERAQFSAAERTEILESRMSYYETDLLVVGWTAALIYDTPEGAAPTMQLLEYANSQLLEFRHYDAVLTDLLAGVYRSLEKKGGIFKRWRLARDAERLNTIRLDVRELTERVDNSIKFLSDMFAARLYRMAAAKIGVPDYRTLVEQKLQAAGELYAFMMDRFYQGRAFLLELMVVIILIIELVFLFRGIK